MKKLVALCLLLALLCGCNVDTIETMQTTQTEPLDTTEEPVAVKERDSFGMTYLPTYGFHPYTCTAMINRASFSLLYESLFVVSDQFRAEPFLCKTFRVSEDALTYHFELLGNVEFSDGSALTASDVKASLEAAMESPFYAARLKNISSISADSDSELTIRLKIPYENFCLMLDVPILKASSLDSSYPVGTGAFVRRGEMLLRNEHWWQSQTAGISVEKIPLFRAETANDVRDGFEFGSADLVYCDPNAPAAVGYRCDYEVWEAPTTVLHYIGFNLVSGYFSNEMLRVALTHAIDRETLRNETYGGFAQASVLPCSPSSDLYDKDLAEQYGYASGKFYAAVNNSGVLTSGEYADYTGTFLVCSEDPKRIEAAEHIVQVLNDAGLHIKIDAKEREDYEAALKNGLFDLYYGEVRLTSNFDLSEFFSFDGSLCVGGIGDAALMGLCQGAVKNSGSYVELCAQVMERGMLCPVLFKSYAVYATRGMMQNITPAVDYIFRNAAAARTLSDADKTYEEAAP